MPSQPSRNPLPFEPRQKKKKPPKSPIVASQSASETQKPTQANKNSETQKPSKYKKTKAANGAIPEVVSQRMLRRMAIFSGIPTILGMSSFVVFYWIVSHDLVKIPTYAVGAVSLGLFGLGVVGLSYGLFSASWDEERSGDWWGWQEVQGNFAKTVNAWRAAKKEAKEN